MVKNNKDDFHYQSLLKEQLDHVSSHIDQPQKFAQLFCNAAQTQKSIDHSLRDIFLDLLENNQQISTSIKKITRQTIKEDRWNLLGKVWGYVYGTVATIIISLCALVLKKYFG